MAWFPYEGYSMRVSENVKRGFLDDSKLSQTFLKILPNFLLRTILRWLYKSQLGKNVPNTTVVTVKRGSGWVRGRHLDGSLWVMNQILITF
jgi:hypothetical protein